MRARTTKQINNQLLHQELSDKSVCKKGSKFF